MLSGIEIFNFFVSDHLKYSIFKSICLFSIQVRTFNIQVWDSTFKFAHSSLSRDTSLAMVMFSSKQANLFRYYYHLKTEPYIAMRMRTVTILKFHGG